MKVYRIGSAYYQAGVFRKALALFKIAHGSTRVDEKGRTWYWNQPTGRWRVQRTKGKTKANQTPSLAIIDEDAVGMGDVRTIAGVPHLRTDAGWQQLMEGDKVHIDGVEHSYQDGRFMSQADHDKRLAGIAAEDAKRKAKAERKGKKAEMTPRQQKAYSIVRENVETLEQGEEFYPGEMLGLPENEGDRTRILAQLQADGIIEDVGFKNVDAEEREYAAQANAGTGRGWKYSTRYQFVGNTQRSDELNAYLASKESQKPNSLGAATPESDRPPSALPEQPAGVTLKPKDSQSESDKVPQSVKDYLKRQMTTIKTWNEKVRSARRTDKMFAGGGRYTWEATGGGQQPDFSFELGRLEEKRKFAAQNGVDFDKLLAELGYEEPIQLEPHELD